MSSDHDNDAQYYDEPTASEEQEQKRPRQKEPPRPSVRVGLFGKEIWWVWIVLALIVVLALLIYIYICYARHCKRTRVLASKAEQAEAAHRPTFGQANKTRYPTSASRAKVIESLERMTLLIPAKTRRSKMIVPEDEWRGDAGLEWIETKLRRLDKPSTEPTMSTTSKTTSKTGEAGKHFKPPRRVSKKLHTRIQISLSNHYNQDWNNQGGVFDIFNRANNVKARARLGTCGTDELPLLEGASSIWLPFDADYERLSRRTDGKYQHKTWWK